MGHIAKLKRLAKQLGDRLSTSMTWSHRSRLPAGLR